MNDGNFKTEEVATVNEVHFISPPWSGRHGIEVYSTTRLGGFSNAPYDALNLGLHVNDDPVAVQRNRDLLCEQLKLKQQPVWLKQVHGTKVVCADDLVKPPSVRRTLATVPDKQEEAPEADASWTAQSRLPIAVLTADCLPIVLASGAHQRFSIERKSIAVVHAGWRGLAAGVLQNAIDALGAKPGSIAAWLGPAIGPQHFEVGPEVREEFLRNVPGISDDCFFESPLVTPTFEERIANQERTFDLEGTVVDIKSGRKHNANKPGVASGGKCFADLYAIARIILAEHNIVDVSGGNHCTYRDQELFYSYRRDGAESGRMATLAIIRDN